MKINLKAVFKGDNNSTYCFKCAVNEIVNGANENIVPEIDDYSSEYDGRNTTCDKCGEHI